MNIAYGALTIAVSFSQRKQIVSSFGFSRIADALCTTCTSE
jgi:hypothetical protein